MKKLFVLLFISSLFLFGCSNNIVGFYFVQPVVKISADTTTLTRVVPEGDSDGWQTWDSGVDSFIVTMQIKETEGFEAYIESVTIELWDIDGNKVSTIGDKTFVPPLELPAGATDSITNVWVYIDEGDANDIEDADPNYRQGYITYKVGYYDDKGNWFTSMKFYRQIILNHPSK